jgi:hypothetical protein
MSKNEKTKKYELVNPYIIGSFDRVVSASNSLQAAHLTYQSLSQHFSEHLPRFKFTLQRVKSDYQTGGGKDSDYIHFELFETKSKKNYKGIEYIIKPITSSLNIDNFQQKLQNFLKKKKKSPIFSSEEEEHHQQSGGSLNYDDLVGGKKYIEDEDLDPELEKILYDDDEYKPKKKKMIKETRLTALSGPLKGNSVFTSPIVYYRYDPVIYADTYSYIPIFTTVAKPKRIVYDTQVYPILNSIIRNL